MNETVDHTPASLGIGISDIKAEVGVMFDVSINSLDGHRRARRFAEPRHIAMYLACRHTKLSLPMIGRCFGGRDHTTVMYGERRIAEKIRTNETFAEVIVQLEARLRERAPKVRRSEDSQADYEVAVDAFLQRIRCVLLARDDHRRSKTFNALNQLLTE